ncbi:hypothetical protein FACS189459_0300 [Bacilli bacterium]|nr:hypothetical protein FACS189459_0300 [Bacilli bacterium]
MEYAGGIDIGLHDQMFFAWKRSHIEVGMLDLSNPLALNDEIKTTSPVTGSYLHIAGIVITIIDLLCITFSIYLMCAKQKTLNLNKHYKIISIMTISGMSILLIMAYVMRSGAVFGAFFNIELNTKFNRNIVEYLG